MLTALIARPLLAKVIGGAVIAAILAMAVTIWAIDRDRDRLFNEIHDEDTGYIVRLNTCRGNQARLESAVEYQNRRILDLSAAGQRIAAQTEAELAEAEARIAAALEAARTARSFTPAGTTALEQYDSTAEWIAAEAARLAQMEATEP